MSPVRNPDLSFFSSSLFELLLLHTDESRLQDPQSVDCLSKSFFSEPIDEATAVRRFGFLAHRLNFNSESPSKVVQFFPLLGSLLRQAVPPISVALKRLVFAETLCISGVCRSSTSDPAITQG